MKRSIFFFAVLLLSVSTNAQFCAKIGLTGSLAIGDMSDYYDGGPGIDLNVKYLIANKYGIGISSGFQYFFSKEWNGFDDVEYDIIPIRLSFAYYLGQKKFRPYFGAELGLNISELSYTYEYEYYDAFRDIWYSAGDDSEYSNARFGAAPVLGFQLDFNRLIALDVNTKVNFLTGVEEGDEDKQAASYLNLNLGLVFKF
jgi:hypothetical protein